MKYIKYTLLVLLLIIFIGSAVIFIIGEFFFSKALVIKSNYSDQGEYIEVGGFKDSTRGIIFYPGALVDEKAYIDLLYNLSNEVGVNVYIVKMPLHFAFFNINGGKKVILDHPQIKSWVIIGHSLGGAMMSAFYNNCFIPERNHCGIDKSIFWASYPASKMMEVKSLMLYGSEDGLTNPKTRNDGLAKLMQGTRLELIQGMNHAQFGNYGKQRGDNDSKITLEDAWKQIVNITSNFILDRESMDIIYN